MRYINRNPINVYDITKISLRRKFRYILKNKNLTFKKIVSFVNSLCFLDFQIYFYHLTYKKLLRISIKDVNIKKFNAQILKYC